MMPSDLERKKQDLCLACLECCKHLVFFVRPQAAVGQTWIRALRELESFYKIRGCGFKKLTNNWGGIETCLVEVPFPCPHLTKYGCDFYNDRPDICRKYDGRRDPMMSATCRWRELDAV